MDTNETMRNDTTKHYTLQQKIIYTILAGISIICYFAGWIKILDSAAGTLSSFIDLDINYGSISLLKIISVSADAMSTLLGFGTNEGSEYLTLIIIGVALVFMIGVIVLVMMMNVIWRHNVVSSFKEGLIAAIASTGAFIIAILLINSWIGSQLSGYTGGFYSDYISLTAAPYINIFSLIALLIIQIKGYRFENLPDSIQGVNTVLKDKISKVTSTQNSHNSDAVNRTVKCTKCGQDNSADSKFCMICGASLLEEKKFCINCGVQLDSEAQFCPECGNRVVTGGETYEDKQ